MTFDLNATIKTLRDDIVTALGSDLGTYTLPGGVSKDAIAVDDGTGIYPPQGTEVSGLEAIILIQSDINVAPLIQGQLWTYENRIAVKQWGEGDTISAVNTIVNQLFQINCQVTNIVRIPKNPVVGSIEITTITFEILGIDSI